MPFGILPLARAVWDNCHCERTSRKEMAEEAVPWGHWIADPNMAAPEDDRRHSALASTVREQWAWGQIAAPQQWGTIELNTQGCRASGLAQAIKCAMGQRSWGNWIFQVTR